MVKLLNCPFCDCPGFLDQHKGDGPDGLCYQAMCSHCSCQIGHELNKDAAITAWNTRALSGAQLPGVEAGLKLPPWQDLGHDAMAAFGRVFQEGIRTGEHGFYETFGAAWNALRAALAQGEGGS